LPTDLGSDEFLIRFVYDSKGIRQDGTIKPKEFLPHPKHNNLSVFKKFTSDESAIWNLSDEIRPDGKKGIARGEIKASTIAKIGLIVDFDNEPPNHANVEGWPPNSEKEKQLSLAQELALNATGFRRS
jgi:hypothetical protein